MHAITACFSFLCTTQTPRVPCGYRLQVPAIYTSVPQGRNLSDAAAAACSCIKRGSHKSSERQPIMGPDDEDMDSLHYFGVFDGHGGADAAKFCASRMHAVVLEEINAAMAASSSNKVSSGGALEQQLGGFLPLPLPWHCFCHVAGRGVAIA